ncbi:methyltransferase domain-containing protein [Candidatus Woesearchaeota archaeon]|nr:methyltransferase domain-containing protein [Candidatus Woesearchaeota archaeon]
MTSVLPNSFFEQKPRDRGLDFFDSLLPQLAELCYKVAPLDDNELPNKDFPSDLAYGLSHWGSHRNGLTRILNLGSGESTLSADFGHSKLVQVVDADVYPPSRTNPNYIAQDANKPFRFEDEQFDLVLASYLFRYLEDPIRTLNEMVRVCKPEGYVIFNGGRRISLDEMNFFGTSVMNQHNVICYNDERWGDGDWVILHLKIPKVKFNVKLDLEKSQTVITHADTSINIPVYAHGSLVLEKRDIACLARFVYHRL